MDNGYVKLWRKSLESQVWQNTNLWQVWCWCLMKANYKERWVGIQIGKGTTEVKVGPGQFVFGRHEAARELRMSPSTVRNQIEKLKNIENLDIQPDKHYSIITIRNWTTYQVIENTEDNQQDSRRTTEGQPKDTDKNSKNSKEGKEEDIMFGKPNNGIPFSEIIFHLNEKTGQAYRPTSVDTKTLIRARWKEGFRLEDFFKVIDNMVGAWLGDSKMEQYLRPKTLFSAGKFEGYLNRPEKKDYGDKEPF